MKKLIIFLVISLGMFAKDTSVTIGENALNKFLTGIGGFSGSGKIDKLITKNIINFFIYFVPLGFFPKY
jgi:hypothetical protein